VVLAGLWRHGLHISLRSFGLLRRRFGTRESELARLHRIRPNLTTAQVMDEEFTVREDPGARPDVVNGVLTLDRLTLERASVVALTVAQSAAMDYYDRIVDRCSVIPTSWWNG